MPSIRPTAGVSATGLGKLLPLLAVAALLAPAGLAVQAQQQPLPQINAPGQLGPKPPVGSGGCSMTAPTCAAVAPAIIHSALGPSLLGRNLRLLSTLTGTTAGARGNRAASGGRVAQWAVEAFRKAGVDDVHVENDAGSFETKNVVAVIRGRTQAKGFVIMGAGLETGHSSAIPLGSACNAALVVEAARAIHTAGTRPFRSIRFILFGGGQQGMAGSRAYARAHLSELDHADAVVIYDAGDGPVAGYDLDGRRSLEAPLRKALAPAAPFGPGHDSYTPDLENAALGFLLEGVPTIVATPHGGSFSLPALDLAALKRHVALAALTAYGIADLPERLGTRLTRTQTEQLLRRTGLENKMKMAGLWPEWKQGPSGRRR
ncbi:MAG TPA: M28 family peptidase [Candidatus Dormibacteraeota bacterium]|nr:M28 family peptidase [Candidatus Dormibacteraeota bacterium]